MNKQEFLCEIRKGLKGLPEKDVEERISFYGEMIDDRMEEGKTEEQAVAETGTPDEIVSGIIADIPLSKIVQEKIRPKRSLKVWEITLFIFFSPILFSLLIAAIAVVFSLFTVLFSLAISLYAVDLAVAAASLYGLFSFVVISARGNPSVGAAFLGIAIFCIGAAILLFYGSNYVLKKFFVLLKNTALLFKRSVIGKEKMK